MRKIICTLAIGAAITLGAGCEHHVDAAYSPDHYFQLGLAEENTGNTKRAMMHYGEAIDTDSMHAPSLYHLGVLQTNSYDYARAVKTWRQYVKATHGAAEAWSDLGWTYERMGWPLAAEGAYRHGIASSARCTTCQTNLGLLLARQGQSSEALLHLQMAMTPAKAHENLALIYREQGLNSKADAELAKASALDPTNVASNDVDNDDDDAAYELDDTELELRAEQTSHEREMNGDVESTSAQNDTDLMINPDPH